MPGERLHVRRDAHDGRASHPRLGGARRSEPLAPRATRERRRAQPACRRVRGRVRPERVVLRLGSGGPPRSRHQGSVTEQNWGSVLTLGVEEELMLVDAETHSQRPASSEVIPRVSVERGLVKHELFESIVELNSGICDSPDDALAVVRELRRATQDAARAIGCTIAAAGSHPTDIASEQAIADDPHYVDFVEYAGPTARRQGVQGLHVHVGMPDAETCLRVMEHVIPWLPVMLALSANSPWFEGERTGLLSTRAEILGLLPRHGAPPRFETWADWERLVRRFVDAGVVPGYGAIHWAIPPPPRFG